MLLGRTVTIDKQDNCHIKTKLQRTKLKGRKEKEFLYLQNTTTVQLKVRSNVQTCELRLSDL